MSIRTAHLTLITTAVVAGLTFTGFSVSRALSDSPNGSWRVVATALVVTCGLAAYLRTYAARTAQEPQPSERQ